MSNKEIAKILKEIKRLLEIKGETSFNRLRAYDNAVKSIKELDQSLENIYKEKGIKGIQNIPAIGEKTAKKIQKYIEKGRIKQYEELKQETAIRQIVTHFFETKEVDLKELKRDSKKRKIVYSRYTKPAKQLLELAGSIENAKKAITTVADWAKSRNLDYAIETVFKKWLELDRLRPKEVVKKPYYRDDPMVWSETKKKWFVISPIGEWLEYADKESEIEWRIQK